MIPVWQQYMTHENGLERLIQHWQIPLPQALLQSKRLLILRMFKQQLMQYDTDGDCIARYALEQACQQVAAGQHIPSINPCQACRKCP